MLQYRAKKGTNYILKVRKRALRGDIQEKLDEFKSIVISIDKKKLPSKSVLSKSPDKYQTKYKEYLKEIKKECDKALNWVGADKKRSIGSARPLISALRKEIEAIDYESPYFYYLLKELKEANPKHVRLFEELEKKEFSELSKVIMHIKKDLSDRFPSSLIKQISKLPYQHPALKYLKINRTSHLKYKNESKERATKKHKKPIEFKVREIIATAELFINNRTKCDWYLLVCSVVALTGRRPIEVMKTGEFSKSKLENHIKFYGQAKIRNREDVPHDIPVIGSTPATVLDAIKIIRAERDFSESTNDFVNNTTAIHLNSQLRKHYENDYLDLKTLRTIYAVVIDRDFYDKFGSDVSKPMYISNALGHSNNDVNMQVRYAWIRPDWSEAQPINVAEKENQARQAAMQKLIDIIESCKESIINLQQRGNAYELLTEEVLASLRAGKFVRKTDMERDPETRTSKRSRKTVEAFIKALKLPKGWPSKIEEWM
jgi:hypothetical protein